MRGRLLELVRSMDGKQRVTIELDGDFRQGFDTLKAADVDIEIRKYRQRRSKDANAYFHVLVNRIAAATGQSDSDVKRELVLDWGVIDRDGEGNKIAFKLPASVDATKFYKYAKFYKQTVENGKAYKCWAAYKETHEMDTGEMARLIDGAISAATELGIETDTPEQLARYRQEWGIAPERN